jgi:hypothetical protein
MSEESVVEMPSNTNKRNMKSEYPNRKIRSDKQLSAFYAGSLNRLQNILSDNEMKHTLKQNTIKEQIKTLTELSESYKLKINKTAVDRRPVELLGAVTDLDKPTNVNTIKRAKIHFC